MARKNSTTAKHSPRRKAAPGVKLARKLYPYVRAEQEKNGLAPAMRQFIEKNTAALEEQGNKPGTLNALNRMARGKSSGALRRAWTRTSQKGTKASRILSLMDKRNISRSAAKSELAGAHTVSFGQDPKRK